MGHPARPADAHRQSVRRSNSGGDALPPIDTTSADSVWARSNSCRRRCHEASDGSPATDAGGQIAALSSFRRRFSVYPAVIPVLTQHYAKLKRNLLYIPGSRGQEAGGAGEAEESGRHRGTHRVGTLALIEAGRMAVRIRQGPRGIPG